MTPSVPDLHLRAPTLADADALLAFELANRAWFEAWVTAREPSYYEPAGVRAAIEAATRARLGDHAYQYLAVSDGRIVGRVNLTAVKRPHFNSADLGYRVGEHEGGRGVASRAVALCLAEAFGPLGLWRVEATARPQNQASIRVLERNGFRAFGQSRRSFRLNGEWFDRVHFECHREPRG